MPVGGGEGERDVAGADPNGVRMAEVAVVGAAPGDVPAALVPFWLAAVPV